MAATETPEPPQSPLLALPPEIREHIYALILAPAANRTLLPDTTLHYNYSPALNPLMHLNRQIHHEARKIFRDLNCFVLVETPWPEAQNHVAQQGHVPMLATGLKAARFKGHSMTVSIDAAEAPMLAGYEQRFLVLAEDLGRFTQMWFYSNLTHPGLNPQLRLTLRMRDPFVAEEGVGVGKARMTAARQRTLLLPFGRVKDLDKVVITGEPEPEKAIRQALVEEQGVASASPEACLREATRLKLAGNAMLAEGRCEETLELYRQAWLAMHIVIRGRERIIHADAFFGRELREEPYKHKQGQAERLVLRVQLVANTCQVYLKLKQWDECIYWGMRTVNMLRDAMGVEEWQDVPPHDEAVLGFPAADQMGKIYYRTAVAWKEKGDKQEARRLLRVAVVYLPRDEMVKKEIAACALRLG